MTRGRLPRPVDQLQRPSRAATRAQLAAIGAAVPRPLPEREDGRPWHPHVIELWRSVWESPIAAELLEADVPGLLVLAELSEAFWRRPSAKAATELRHLASEYGLSPVARRRLQWSTARVLRAAEVIDARPVDVRPVRSVRERLAVLADPRHVLRDDK